MYVNYLSNISLAGYLTAGWMGGQAGRVAKLEVRKSITHT